MSLHDGGPRRDLLLVYAVDDTEQLTDAIVDAFLAGNVDVFDKPTCLSDWVDPGVFRYVERSGDRELELTTRIWDHTVLVSADEVRIYR